jgi:hypothetical protein
MTTSTKVILSDATKHTFDFLSDRRKRLVRFFSHAFMRDPELDFIRKFFGDDGGGDVFDVEVMHRIFPPASVGMTGPCQRVTAIGRVA